MSKRLIIGGVIVALGASLVYTLTDAAPAPTQPDYTFASMPDYLNLDVGEVRGIPYWKPGEPNSINKYYRDDAGPRGSGSDQPWGLIRYGDTAYLVGRVDSDRLDLELRGFNVDVPDWTGKAYVAAGRQGVQ